MSQLSHLIWLTFICRSYRCFQSPVRHKKFITHITLKGLIIFMFGWSMIGKVTFVKICFRAFLTFLWFYFLVIHSQELAWFSCFATYVPSDYLWYLHLFYLCHQDFLSCDVSSHGSLVYLRVLFQSYSYHKNLHVFHVSPYGPSVYLRFWF